MRELRKWRGIDLFEDELNQKNILMQNKNHSNEDFPQMSHLSFQLKLIFFSRYCSKNLLFEII